MQNQPRTAKVLAALLASMTVGAIVLMALGNNAPSAGAFCLASYYKLKPIEEVVECQVGTSAKRWSKIEIYYSKTKGGNLEQLASLAGHSNSGDVNFHFVVCNSFGETDGQVQASEKWQRQWSCAAGGSWPGGNKTIRIYLIGQGEFSNISDCQLTRTTSLVEELCRKFKIKISSVKYPKDWRL